MSVLLELHLAHLIQILLDWVKIMERVDLVHLCSRDYVAVPLLVVDPVPVLVREVNCIDLVVHFF